MTRVQVATAAVKAMTTLLGLRKLHMDNESRKAATRDTQVRLHAQTAKDLEAAFVPVIRQQIAEAVKKVSSGVTDADKLLSDKKWRTKIIDAAFPVIAAAMVNSSTATLESFGVRLPAKRAGKRRTKSPRTKSTATDWLEDNDIDLPGGLGAELPESMRQRIADSVRETFEQDYWEDMTASTKEDLRGILSRGLEDGQSISDMAGEIKNRLGIDEYYHNRSRTIAITESGHALNGARVSAINDLQDEVGVVLKREWLSILGPTTRDSHANLDGVPADEEGMWELGGVLVPWPGHIDLPVEERANCRCTVVTSWGMGDDEAQDLIDEYNQRISEEAEDEAGYEPPLVKYSPDQPRDDQGRFGEGGTNLAPDTGGGSGGTSHTPKDRERVERSLRSHNPSTKEKQDESERAENVAANKLGATKSDDNRPMDLVVDDLHGVELKVMHDAKEGRVNMRRDSRERKEKWAKEEKGRTVHTVLIDNRDKFQGGAHADKYSGHQIYYASGVGAFRLSQMEKIGSWKELRAKIRGKKQYELLR